MANFVGFDAGGVEAGIGEYLVQGGGQAPLGIVRQLLQIDAEDLAQLQQQRHRHRPFVVLDQIEIARADAEPAGHELLVEAALLPQPADFLAEKRLFRCHGPVSDLQIYKTNNS